MALQRTQMYFQMTLLRLLGGSFLALVVAVAAVAKVPVDVDASPLSKCWSYQASPDLSVAAGVDQKNIYFIDTDSRLHAVDMDSGTKLWSSDIGGTTVADLLVSGSSLFVATSLGDISAGPQADGRLRSISTQTGITSWVSDITVSDRISIGVRNGTVVTATLSGEVSAFVRETGAAAWSKNLGFRLASYPIFEQGALTIVTVNNELLRIGERGEVSRIAKLDNTPSALFSRTDSGTLVGDDRGNLVFISPGDKRVWSFKNGARISHILPFDSEYIVASDDNFIYKLTRGGAVEWKRRLSGRTTGKPLLIGNSFVASVVGEGDVYVIDARNGKILNRIEIGDGISAEISSTSDHRGFAILHPQGLIRYSEEACSAK